MSSMSPNAIPSPCVRNCCLDDGNVCMGCGRTLEEIVAWSNAGAEEKTAILARSRARQTARARQRFSPRGAASD